MFFFFLLAYKMKMEALFHEIVMGACKFVFVEVCSKQYIFLLFLSKCYAPLDATC